MCTPAVHAAGNITTDAAVQQTVNQDVDEMKLKELAEFRKKYKFPEPKASESELKAAQMGLKILYRDRSRFMG